MSGPDLTGSTRRRRRERLVKGVLACAGGVSIAISALIVFSLVGEAFSFVRNVELSALWSKGWFPRRGLYDVKTIFVGSLIVTGIAMLVAAPLGLGAAVWLSEYAPDRLNRIVKPVLEVLAGIPSVIVGYFAISWINPNLTQRFFDASGFNLASAGIGVGLLVMPLVASISEDAMRAVPRSLREAAYGIGSRPRTVSLRVVLPAAISGIVAALIVGISRAIGETMVVAIAAGASGGSLFSTDPFASGQTMTGAMASLATGTDRVRGASDAFQSLFFVGLLLFLVTLALNVVGQRVVERTRERY